MFFHVRVRLAGSEYLWRQWWQGQYKNIPGYARACELFQQGWMYKIVLVTDRSHNAGEAPLCAEESVTVQASLIVQVALEYVHSNDVRVHGIGILPHGSLNHWLPWVTACMQRQTERNEEEQQVRYLKLLQPLKWSTSGISSWWGSWM